MWSELNKNLINVKLCCGTKRRKEKSEGVEEQQGNRVNRKRVKIQRGRKEGLITNGYSKILTGESCSREHSACYARTNIAKWRKYEATAGKVWHKEKGMREPVRFHVPLSVFLKRQSLPSLIFVISIQRSFALSLCSRILRYIRPIDNQRNTVWERPSRNNDKIFIKRLYLTRLSLFSRCSRSEFDVIHARQTLCKLHACLKQSLLSKLWKFLFYQGWPQLPV